MFITICFILFGYFYYGCVPLEQHERIWRNKRFTFYCLITYLDVIVLKQYICLIPLFHCVFNHTKFYFALWLDLIAPPTNTHFIQIWPFFFIYSIRQRYISFTFILCLYLNQVHFIINYLRTIINKIKYNYQMLAAYCLEQLSRHVSKVIQYIEGIRKCQK